MSIPLDTRRFIQERFEDRQSDSQLIQLVQQFSPNVKVQGQVQDVGFFTSFFNQLMEPEVDEDSTVDDDSTNVKVKEYARMQRGQQWLDDLNIHYQEADKVLEQIKQVKSNLEKVSNPEAQHDLSRNLIDLEKSFETIRLSLTKYKCDMVREMITTIEKETPTPASIAQQKLLEQLNVVLKEYEKRRDQIEQFSKELIRQTAQLEKSFKPHPVYDRMVKEHALDMQRYNEDVDPIIQDFLSLSSDAPDPQKAAMAEKWHGDLGTLHERCEQQVQAAKEIRERLKKTPDIREANHLELELLRRQQSFEKTRAQILATKCDMIRSINYYLVLHDRNPAAKAEHSQFTNKLTQSFGKFLKEGQELTQDFKDIKRHMHKTEIEIKEAKKTESTMPVSASKEQFVIVGEDIVFVNSSNAVAKHVEEETWHLTPWGQLLTQKSSLINKVSDALGLGFQSSVDKLKQTKRDLKTQVEQTEDAKQKEELKKQLSDVRRTLYQTILLRTVDVIEEKRRFLKNNEASLTPNNRQIVLEDLQVLDVRFKQLLFKFDNLPVQNMKFLEKMYSEIEGLTKAALTFGYLNGRSITTQEMVQKKHYADLGYCMIEDVQLWLKDLRVPADPKATWQDVLKNELTTFLKWADEHPRTAANLVGDMVLTCAILGDETYTNQFKQMMMGKAYTTSFLTAWGTLPEQDPVVTKDQLKFKALADLCRYAPFAAGVGKGVQTVFVEGRFNLTDIITRPLIEGMKGVAIQQAGRIIPPEMEGMAVAAVQIIQREDYQKILEFQRNVALVGIGGTIKRGLMNPGGFLNDMKTNATKWWRTIEQSSGREKVYRILSQAVLPAAGVTLAGGLIVVSVLGGPIGIAVALSAAFVIITASLGIAARLNTVLNTAYSQTATTVEAQMRDEEKQRIKSAMRVQLEQDSDNKKAIQNQVNLYIEDLVRKGALPVVENPNYDLKDIPIESIQKKRQGFERDLRQALDKQILTLPDMLNKRNPPEEVKPYHIIHAFNDIVKVQDLRTEIQRSIEDMDLPPDQQVIIREQLLAQTLDNLVTDWLKPNLNKAFVEQCIDLSFRYPNEENYKFSISESDKDPEAYLKQQLNDKYQNEAVTGNIAHDMQNIGKAHEKEYATAAGPRQRNRRKDWMV